MTPPTMRTHPLVRGTTCTNTVNLGITTRCSMRCPNCSIDINGIRDRGEARHASVGDIAVWLGTLTKGGPLKRVHVTGGEPTLHDMFGPICDLLMAFRLSGGVETVSLETNGFRAVQNRHQFERDVFDLVFCTHYEKDAVYPGSPDNTDKVEFLQEVLGDRLVREAPVRHLPGHVGLQTLALGRTIMGMEREAMRAEETACSKWHDPGLPAGVYDGMLYRCCVTVGIDRRLGIPLTADWRTDVAKLSKGCVRCAFRGT